MGVCSATARQTCGTPSWEGPEEADSGRKWSDGGQGRARALWAVTQSGRLGSARRGRGAAQCSLGRWGGGLRAPPRRLWGAPLPWGPWPAGRCRHTGRLDWASGSAVSCLRAAWLCLRPMTTLEGPAGGAAPSALDPSADGALAPGGRHAAPARAAMLRGAPQDGPAAGRPGGPESAPRVRVSPGRAGRVGTVS